jgi:hypothetical protein
MISVLGKIAPVKLFGGVTEHNKTAFFIQKGHPHRHDIGLETTAAEVSRLFFRHRIFSFIADTHAAVPDRPAQVSCQRVKLTECTEDAHIEAVPDPFKGLLEDFDILQAAHRSRIPEECTPSSRPLYKEKPSVAKPGSQGNPGQTVPAADISNIDPRGFAKNRHSRKRIENMADDKVISGSLDKVELGIPELELTEEESYPADFPVSAPDPEFPDPPLKQVHAEAPP